MPQQRVLHGGMFVKGGLVGGPSCEGRLLLRKYGFRLGLRLSRAQLSFRKMALVDSASPLGADSASSELPC